MYTIHESTTSQIEKNLNNIKNTAIIFASQNISVIFLIFLRKALFFRQVLVYNIGGEAGAHPARCQYFDNHNHKT